jgi:hypothetical protein
MFLIHIEMITTCQQINNFLLYYKFSLYSIKLTRFFSQKKKHKESAPYGLIISLGFLSHIQKPLQPCNQDNFKNPRRRRRRRRGRRRRRIRINKNKKLRAAGYLIMY